MSPYAQSLIRKMDQASTEVDRAKTEVLLACYWARVGDLQAAEEIRTRLRAKFPSGLHGDLTVLLMCLDGLMLFYSNEDASSIARIGPAHALAATYRFRPEQSFIASWLAHIEFNRSNWPATAAALASSRATLDRTDKATEGRLSLVVADALLYGRQEKLSREWQAHARGQFTALGDHAAIEALLYNWASLRLHSARIQTLDGILEFRQLETLRGEIESAANYHRLAQLRSLDYLLEIAASSLKILGGDHATAAKMLFGLVDRNEVPKDANAQPKLLADLAMCLSLTGMKDEALRYAQLAQERALGGLAPDDDALLSNSLAIAFESLCMTDKGSFWRARSKQSVAQHEASVADLTAELAKGGWLTSPASALNFVH